ncbi:MULTISPECIES: 2-hydroxyacid dehydrogenase [unclassified Chelatococcus]|uniref:2-hydroxyacid dehydrogenase n=1 Tax=unclassified Chelatococcus TaxID=2638111 RepID=UPI000307C543|nr:MULTISPECIES: 2-hydroxyacid dehydrogenase [unclassified Chelatococcus]ALA19020.1 phosphoglycerate dehydrogenase [Chelatococcus sp. CO-6]
MKIVFHGDNARNFRDGFEAMLADAHDIVALSDALAGEGERDHFRTADVIVGIRLDASMPRPERLRLYHAPSAGTDMIDRSLLPAGAALCNCFGHEHAIAEYVMTALLLRHVPIPEADRQLRQGDWSYWAGRPTALRTELGGSTIGLLGFGHIGKAIAERARAFGMRVSVANRSPVAAGPLVDEAYRLDDLAAFMASADVIVVSLPLLPETAGLVGRAALAAMRPDALIMNVGRGPVIDEAALYEALDSRRIGGAIIDTWYRYPTADEPRPAPGHLAFQELDNVVMTPHMSGWTTGTIRRRMQTIADNIRRLAQGEPLMNRA